MTTELSEISEELKRQIVYLGLLAENSGTMETPTEDMLDLRQLHSELVNLFVADNLLADEELFSTYVKLYDRGDFWDAEITKRRTAQENLKEETLGDWLWRVGWEHFLKQHKAKIDLNRPGIQWFMILSFIILAENLRPELFDKPAPRNKAQTASQVPKLLFFDFRGKEKLNDSGAGHAYAACKDGAVVDFFYITDYIPELVVAVDEEGVHCVEHPRMPLHDILKDPRLFVPVRSLLGKGKLFYGVIQDGSFIVRSFSEEYANL